MKIRFAKIPEADECRKINEVVWRDEWKDSGEYHKERAKKQELLVAVEGNKIAGYAAFRRRYWERNFFIEEMAMDPRDQGKGVGSSLIKKLEEICAKEGARLFSSADSQNTPSITFHKKMGFEEAGFITNMFREGKREVVFSKKPAKDYL